MIMPPLPEAVHIRRNAHGFTHSFSHLQMDKYGRDCVEQLQQAVAAEREKLEALTWQAFEIAVERDELRMQLSDLPEAQADMLSTIKQQAATLLQAREALEAFAVPPYPGRNLKVASAIAAIDKTLGETK